MTNDPKTIPPEIAEANNNILTFAERMVTAGVVTVTSPSCPDIFERRIVAHDLEADGFEVVFLAVIDGEPDVTKVNFDFPDSRAFHHIVHSDGLGLTMRNHQGRPLVEYRIR